MGMLLKNRGCHLPRPASSHWLRGVPLACHLPSEHFWSGPTYGEPAHTRKMFLVVTKKKSQYPCTKPWSLESRILPFTDHIIKRERERTTWHDKKVISWRNTDVKVRWILYPTALSEMWNEQLRLYLHAYLLCFSLCYWKPQQILPTWISDRAKHKLADATGSYLSSRPCCASITRWCCLYLHDMLWRWHFNIPWNSASSSCNGPCSCGWWSHDVRLHFWLWNGHTAAERRQLCECHWSHPLPDEWVQTRGDACLQHKLLTLSIAHWGHFRLLCTSLFLTIPKVVLTPSHFFFVLLLL